MSDLISRKQAIDRINKQREHLQPDMYAQDAIGDAAYRICAEFIERLPSAEPNILDDGTLTITVPHGMLSKVNRVIVDEDGTKFCKMMYQDALPSAEVRTQMPSADLISRQDAIRESVWLGINGNYYEVVSVDDLKKLPSAESEAYNLGWKEGREALRKEIWEDGRDRLD